MLGCRTWLVVLLLLAATVVAATAQSGVVVGVVRDETGGPLPGVAVELMPRASHARSTETDAAGGYRFDSVPAGRARVVFALVQFANATRDVVVPATGNVRADAMLHLSLSADVTVTARSTFVNLAAFRLRYFGPRPLVEDGSVQSRATTMVNMDVGYEFRPGLRLSVDAFNLLDARDSDIDYFYRSRLPGEPGDGVDDIHFHPVVPRTARVSLMIGF